MRQSKSSLLSVMNSFKMRLLLLRDLVLNRAILRGFFFYACGGSGYRVDVEGTHRYVALMT